MHRVEKGLVLRAVPYRDADAMLTILTECQGKITAAARGVRRKSSRISAAVQSLAYSEFTFYEASNRFTVNEAEAIELFYDLRSDLVSLSIANYFAEVLEQASDEEVANPELLRLGLNAIYALSKKMYDARIIKAAFELRIASYSGFMPNIVRCAGCGCDFYEGKISLADGLCYCNNCSRGGIPVSSGVISAMRYIFESDVKRIFSFTLSEDGIITLSHIAEDYLKTQFGREFKTLSFYKSIL